MNIDLWLRVADVLVVDAGYRSNSAFTHGRVVVTVPRSKQYNLLRRGGPTDVLTGPGSVIWPLVDAEPIATN